MKILAKQRLMARQLPEDLKKTVDSATIRHLAQLGIDFNSVPFEEVPKNKALRLLKNYYDKLGYKSGALVCICPDYARKYQIVVIHNGPRKVETNIGYYTASGAVEKAIKIYFFKPTQKDKALSEKLYTRELNRLSNRNKNRVDLNNLKSWDSIDNYDKSGYKKNDLEKLRRSIKDAASSRAKHILSNTLSIIYSSLVYALGVLTKENNSHNVSQRLNLLGKSLTETDNILQKTFKALGYRGKANNILDQLENIDNQSTESFELSSFLYKLDTERFEQEFKKQLENITSKAL